MKQVRAEIYILHCLFKFSIFSYKDFLLCRIVSFHAYRVKKINYPASAFSSFMVIFRFWIDFNQKLNSKIDSPKISAHINLQEIESKFWEGLLYAKGRKIQF